MTFLGRILSTEALKPEKEKIEAIKAFPAPRKLKQLQGFLGLMNFNSKFGRRYGDVAAPLMRLPQKDVKWTWETDKQKAFREVKELFCESEILRHQRPKDPYILQTDASDKAISAILGQRDDEGEIEVINIVHRLLKPAGQKYFTTEKELLAIIWGLDKFSTYLVGAKVEVITGHCAIVFMDTCRFVNQRIARWILSIQDYDIETEHYPEK